MHARAHTHTLSLSLSLSLPLSLSLTVKWVWLLLVIWWLLFDPDMTFMVDWVYLNTQHLTNPFPILHCTSSPPPPPPLPSPLRKINKWKIVLHFWLTSVLNTLMLWRMKSFVFMELCAGAVLVPLRVWLFSSVKLLQVWNGALWLAVVLLAKTDNAFPQNTYCTEI